MAERCEIARDSPDGWRNAAFFVDVVAKDLLLSRDAFKILNVDISNATSKTAGFMSLMHRATLDVELTTADGDRKKLTYIVKEKADGVFGGEMVDKTKAFPKEIDVYSKFLPDFEKLWEAQHVKFGPRVFKTVITPITVIVMEDLNASGFRMKECSAGLNVDDCKKVLEKLAKFHAASVSYYEKNGPYSDDFKYGIYSEDMIPELESYFAQLLNSYLQALEKLEYPGEIIETIRSAKGKIYATASRIFRSDPSKFNVLNHGDPWINNIQFNDDELLIIDYQMAFYGSPSFDLLYFIISSAALDVRTDKFDYLIDHYYDHLTNNLRTLNVKTTVPTRQQLLDDIKAHGLLVCTHSMEGLAMMLALPELEMDMDLLTSQETEGIEFRQKLYSTDRFVETSKKLIPFMWERGFLDVLVPGEMSCRP